jgi:2-amino-4-hydroxy-6-hydroxymethyldihydropteridine diphosphokinase
MNKDANHVVYIALGSNLGDRFGNLQMAVEKLSPDIQVQQASTIYETPPWGFLDQPPYLNQVIQVTTDLPPQELLTHLKHLEMLLGREPTFRNGPRPLDLDLLFYDDLVLQTSKLTIPHPRLRGRAFVLVPLADLAPDYRHPVIGLTVSQLLEESDREGIQVFQIGS